MSQTQQQSHDSHSLSEYPKRVSRLASGSSSSSMPGTAAGLPTRQLILEMSIILVLTVHCTFLLPNIHLCLAITTAVGISNTQAVSIRAPCAIRYAFASAPESAVTLVAPDARPTDRDPLEECCCRAFWSLMAQLIGRAAGNRTQPQQ